jgi:hypothetical protein
VERLEVERVQVERLDPTARQITQGDDFLTAFWGQNPKAGLIVPGESSDAQ